GPASAAVELHHLQRGTVGVVTDAGDDPEQRLRHDRDAVRPRPRVEHGASRERLGVDPCQARRSAIGDEDLPTIGDKSCGAGKPRQRGEMAMTVMVENIDAIACRVSDEDAASLRVEGTMIELRSTGIGYPDDSHLLERHDILLSWPAYGIAPAAPAGTANR